MLNYHRILPAFVETKSATFHHFLSLASHSSPYRPPSVYSFTKITLFPKTKFFLHDHIKQCEEKEVETIVIPLNGEKIRIDEEGTNKVTKNVREVEGGEEKQQLIFMVVKGKEEASEQKIYKNKDVEVEEVKQEKDKEIKIDKKCIIYVVEGGFRVKETKEEFKSNTMFYNSKNANFLQFLENSSLYFITIN